MLAAMHGRIACVEKLLQVGANVLMFDTLYGRTCLHYAAYYGHSSCLKAILSSAQSTPVAASWFVFFFFSISPSIYVFCFYFLKLLWIVYCRGFIRFVNIRDGKGATPLHLAARQRRPECVHILLDSGALVSASTGRYG